LHEIKLINITDFTLGARYCRHPLLKGRVCIFVYNKLNFTVIDLDKLFNDKAIEACAVKLSYSSFNMLVLAVYRAPAGNFIHFINKLEIIMNLIYNNNSQIIVCGDFNINYLAENNNKRL
jgi:hypothetical protein